MEITVTFSLIYIFDWKCADLFCFFFVFVFVFVFFLFLFFFGGGISPRQNVWTQKLCACCRGFARLSNLSKPDLESNLIKIYAWKLSKQILSKNLSLWIQFLTLSWRRPLSYRNQSNDLHSKSVDWFLYDSGLRHERVK